MNDLIIFCAKYLVAIIALICLVYWLTLKRKVQVQLAIAVILGVAIAMILAKIAGKIYYHPRPFVVHHIKPLVSHSNDNAFPSEHTTLATMLATLIYFYRRRLGYLLFVLAVIVGIGRIAAHVHWPLDIVGGLLIGAIAGWLAYYLARKIQPAKLEKEA